MEISERSHRWLMARKTFWRFMLPKVGSIVHYHESSAMCRNVFTRLCTRFEKAMIEEDQRVFTQDSNSRVISAAVCEILFHEGHCSWCRESHQFPHVMLVGPQGPFVREMTIDLIASRRPLVCISVMAIAFLAALSVDVYEQIKG